MNPSWSRRNNEVAQEVVEGNQDGDDDEFGEFEGFEGTGMESLQAQAAPSPWATFPDLLPVQTSPATPADESDSSGRAFDSHEREPWLQPTGTVPRRGILEVESETQNIQPVRTLNPPDVSLGTNSSPTGRITPDNVHAHSSQGSATSNLSEVRLGPCEISALQKQLDDTRQHSSVLEQQLEQLRQRNSLLESQLNYSQAHIQELNARLQHNEIHAERDAASTSAAYEDFRTTLQQLQKEVATLKELQTEGININTIKQQLLEIKEEVGRKFQHLEIHISDQTSNLEQRLLSRLGEQQMHIVKGVENAMKHCSQQLCQTVSIMTSQDTVQQNGACCSHSEDTLQLVREELQRHETHQRKVLEQERHRQLNALSTALQAALQHLSTALPSDHSHGACGDTVPDH